MVSFYYILFLSLLVLDESKLKTRINLKWLFSRTRSL